MSERGSLSHIDLTITEPERSIPFYAKFFEAVGYRRFRSDNPDFAGPNPLRAAWYIKYPSGAYFGIEVRPARPESRQKTHDRYAPGLHHLAFHAESRDHVDRVYHAMLEAGATILDAPTEYAGAEYSPDYYAVFFADPDGVKLEVVYEPRTNP